MTEDATPAPAEPPELDEEQKAEVLARIAPNRLPCGGRAWAGDVNRNGHGFHVIDGVQRSAPMLVRLAETGQATPKGKKLWSTCGNKLCLDHRSTTRPTKTPKAAETAPADVIAAAESPAELRPAQAPEPADWAIRTARWATNATPRQAGENGQATAGLTSTDVHVTSVTSDVQGRAPYGGPLPLTFKPSGRHKANVRTVVDVWYRLGPRTRRTVKVLAVLAGLAAAGWFHPRILGPGVRDLLPDVEVGDPTAATVPAVNTEPPNPPTTTPATTTTEAATTTTAWTMPPPCTPSSCPSLED